VSRGGGRNPSTPRRSPRNRRGWAGHRASSQ
jgi:hypothetical protein